MVGALVPSPEPLCTLKMLALIHSPAVQIFSPLCLDMPPQQVQAQNRTPGPLDSTSLGVGRMFSEASSVLCAGGDTHCQVWDLGLCPLVGNGVSQLCR